MRIIGYGICGADEKYLDSTLQCFKKLCDETIICLNNATQKDLIESYGFKTIVDNREWGKEQWRIKEDFIKSVVKLKPDWLVCLDMDEVMETDRATLEEYAGKGGIGYYCYLMNLIGKGYSQIWSFMNIRFWHYIEGMDLSWERKALHCGLAPKVVYSQANYAPIIVKHYGLKTQKDRDKKIKRYEKYDPDAKYKARSYYNFLKKPDTKPINNKQKEIEAECKDLYFKEYKIMSNKKQEFYYIKTKDGRILDIPAVHLEEELLRGSKLISKDPIKVKGGAVKSTMVDIEPTKEDPIKEVPKLKKKVVKKDVKDNRRNNRKI